MKYELVKYKSGDIEIEVNVSPQENTVWMTQDPIGLLFNRSQSVVSRYIKSAFENGDFNRDTSIQFLHRSTPNSIYHRPSEYYNLDVILWVGQRTKSDEYRLFYFW